MSDDEADAQYVHAEHFGYLEDTFGDFGSRSKTNLEDSSLSVGLEDEDTSLDKAAEDFEEEIEKEIKRELIKAKDARSKDELEDDDVMILSEPPKGNYYSGPV